MRTSKLLSICAAAALVAACGSGTKTDEPVRTVAYTGPTTAAAITSASQVATAAGEVKIMVDTFSESATGGVGLAGVVSGPRARSINDAVKDAVKLAARFRQPTAASVTGALVSVTENCPGGGTVTHSAFDADGLATTTAPHDYVQVAFSGCDLVGDASVFMDGSLRVEIISTDGAPFLHDVANMTSDVTYGVQVTFGNLIEAWAEGFWFGVNGDVSFLWTADLTGHTLTWQVAGTSFAEAVGFGTEVYWGSLLTGPGGTGQYSDVYVEEYVGAITSVSVPSATRWDFDGRTCSTDLNGCLDVVTNPAFRKVAPDLHPSTGSIEISNGTASIRLTATSGTGDVTVTYDLDVANDPPDPVTVYTTWDCLETPGGCPAL